MRDNEKWATASLRVHSRTMNAQEISLLLGEKPTRTAEKGQLKSLRNPKSAVFGEHLWLPESGLDSTQLEDHIRILVDFIEKKLAAFEALAANCEIDIFCGYSASNGQGGFVLEANLLKRLTVIPIDIVIDLYNSEYPENSETN